MLHDIKNAARHKKMLHNIKTVARHKKMLYVIMSLMGLRTNTRQHNDDSDLNVVCCVGRVEIQIEI